MIYDFVLFHGPENAERLLAYVKQAGIQILSSFNETGGSTVVRASFPPRTLRRFQENFPAGWFQRVP
jgi:hypothetical protein